MLRFRRPSESTGGPTVLPPLDEVRSLLRVRLAAPPPPATPAGEQVIHQEPAEGLVGILTCDLPEGPVDLCPSDAAPWAIPEVALFGTGIGQLRQVTEFQIAERPLPGDLHFTAVRGSHAFTASQILVLDRFLAGGESPYGALACVPKTDLLLVLPIEDDRALRAIPELARLALVLHQKGPSPLSTGVYWWRKGGLMLLPTSLGPEGITFSPPRRFVAHVMEPLQGLR